MAFRPSGSIEVYNDFPRNGDWYVDIFYEEEGLMFIRNLRNLLQIVPGKHDI